MLWLTKSKFLSLLPLRITVGIFLLVIGITGLLRETPASHETNGKAWRLGFGCGERI